LRREGRYSGGASILRGTHGWSPEPSKKNMNPTGSRKGTAPAREDGRSLAWKGNVRGGGARNVRRLDLPHRSFKRNFWYLGTSAVEVPRTTFGGYLSCFLGRGDIINDNTKQ